MDKKAKSILFKTYWTAKGWKGNIELKTEDFEYAKSKGLMFDSLTIELTELKTELKLLVNRIKKEKLVKGFLSSLTNKRLDWRSAIGSYFNAKLVLENKRKFYHSETFKYENEDLNVLNFERIKWGGVRHSDLIYNYIDLKIFEKENISNPTNQDIEIFKDILNCIENSNQGDYPSKLRDRLKNVIKISKDQRHTLMEILACCEILKPKDYNRPTTGRHDWSFVEYWRGEDKFNNQIVNKYFGEILKKKTTDNNA